MFTIGGAIETSAVAHCDAIRKAQKPLGAYHFFRPNCKPADQFAAFNQEAIQNNYGQGDLVPAIDVERCITRGKWIEADPSWCSTIQQLLEMFRTVYGDTLLYCGWATFVQLGQPSWMLSHPLWVPYVARDGNFPPERCSKSPGGKAPVLWQFMWGPLFSQIQMQTSRIAVDQSVCAKLPFRIAGAL